MALTITNHLIRRADAPHIAGLGDGGGTVTGPVGIVQESKVPGAG